MKNALRLTGAVEINLFTQHTGLSIDIISKQLQKASDHGWLEVDDSRTKPTAQGRLFLNVLLEHFLEQSRHGPPHLYLTNFSRIPY